MGLIFFTNLPYVYLFSLVEFLTSLFHISQTMYTLIIFVIMELVDVYGLFLIFFIFTNFILFYYNFFFQIFIPLKNSIATTFSQKNTPLNNVNRLTLFRSTFVLLKQLCTPSTQSFK